ncbi:peptidase inhibitor family I36 protein [Actinomadura hibisca]|uniref:peptidase inhibitor family I36 protein n=1 Tax=Actinomadura hibisca TaxID=68565 RepID=UPI000829BB67|nr:peptidase inhibitor family I36 protein [Actinomadura hibisca]
MQLNQVMRSVLITTVGTGSALALLAGAASASPAPSVQEQIDVQLRNYPGGVQTAPNEVSYRGGQVVVTIPANATAGVAADPCAANAYCFYDGRDFTGRKLTFRDCGGTQYLTNYGFGDKTSSWQNKSLHAVYVYDNATTPPTHMWTEESGAATAVVSTAHYNKADSFFTRCG